MNFYKRKRRMPTVIIVSLIDIFAILLIFVIVTTTFKRAQPSVVIKLAEVGGDTSNAQGRDAEPVLLSIDNQGKLDLNREPITLDQLEPALRRLVTAGKRFALNPDKKAPFEAVAGVLVVLKRAGVSGNVPAFTENIQKGK